MDKEIERKICGILDPTGRTKCPLQSQTDYERDYAVKTSSTQLEMGV